MSTIVGLISIPLIIHPIDDGVERTMDSTYRQWTGYHPLKEVENKQSITCWIKILRQYESVVQIQVNSIKKIGHSGVNVISL